MENNSLNNIKQCLCYINSVDIRNCKIEIIQNLIQSYENGDKKNRCVIREMVSNMEVNLKLLSLSELLSCEAYKNKDLRYVKQALILHSIEDFRWDPRENVIYLSIIWYISEQLKIDIISVFEDVISLSSEQTQYYLNEFFNRPKGLKTLKAMGLKAIIKNNTIDFEQDKPKWM